MSTSAVEIKNKSNSSNKSAATTTKKSQIQIHSQTHSCFVIAYDNEYGYRKYERMENGSQNFVDSIFEATTHDLAEIYRWKKDIEFWNKNREFGKYVIVKMIKSVNIEEVE